MTRSITNVLAIDPGKLTGVAHLRLDTRNNTVTIVQTAELAILGDNPLHAQLLRSTISDWQPSDADEYPLRVVVERFLITPATGKKSQEASAALETIGAVKLMCVEAQYPLDAIMLQSPASAKTTFPNEKLKRLGLWHRGGAGHALDALRHAALYLVSSGWVDTRMSN